MIVVIIENDGESVNIESEQLCSNKIEKMVDIVGQFGTGLNVNERVSLGKEDSFLLGDCPGRSQVQLATHQ